MLLEDKCIIFRRSTIFSSLIGAIIGLGVYGCKEEEPVREDTAPTKSVAQEPSREDNLPEKPASLGGNLENTKIAFASNRDGNTDIYVMNADGSTLKNLTNNPYLDKGPSWSPEGKKIAFMSIRDAKPEIYVMNADGSEQIRLTDNPGLDFSPSWSPDGKR